MIHIRLFLCYFIMKNPTVLSCYRKVEWLVSHSARLIHVIQYSLTYGCIFLSFIIHLSLIIRLWTIRIGILVNISFWILWLLVHFNVIFFKAYFLHWTSTMNVLLVWRCVFMQLQSEFENPNIYYIFYCYLILKLSLKMSNTPTLPLKRFLY